MALCQTQLLKAADIVDDLFLHQQWPASVPLVRVASATLKGHKLRGANVKGESDASLLWAKAVLLNKVRVPPNVFVRQLLSCLPAGPLVCIGWQQVFYE